MKPQDTKACQIHFGVELETVIPETSGVNVGHYHGGLPVQSGRSTYGAAVSAPSFSGSYWKAERDGSIRTNSGQQACEFVSPILHGEDGVRALGDFVGFINQIGAKVNESCGCHITISADSITGSSDANVRAEFARKLAHIAQWHARAIYGQTGTGRHLNHYSHVFSEDVARWVKQMTTAADPNVKHRAATSCGRGMVNFRKLFTHGVVEFRAFAGTRNLLKVQHHVATAIGLCRRRRREEQPEEAAVGLLVEPRPSHDLRKLVLQNSVREDIAAALRSIALRDQMQEVWQWGDIRPQGNRCVLNFYGPPGTGKTRAALGIALRLGQPLYQVDCSAIVSKYLGDMAKHIVQAFRQAAEAGTVLFFDEADSMLSRRVQMGESCATSINQNRNTLMQELDRFEGVVIMTTNLFGNYDEAILRRVARHIEFRLPGPSMREKILRLHLPNAERTPADLRPVALAARGLSGGDILNVCVNAMEAASVDLDPQNWQMSTDLLIAEIRKVQEAKDIHAGRSATDLNQQ